MLRIGLLLIAFLVLTLTVTAEVPQMINYTGRLIDIDGPVTDIVPMTFTIYDAETDGNLKWTESHPLVPVDDGLFNVVLGAGSPPEPIEATIFSGADRWLEITVDGEIITPRIRLLTTPYAFQGNWNLDGDILYTSEDYGVAKHENTLYGVNGVSSHVNLGTNSTTGSDGEDKYGCTVGGGSNNTASVNYTTVGGGNSNIASGLNSTVGGGHDNTASGYKSAISGGYQNTSTGYYSLVGGGFSNSATGYYSTVSGGGSNTAGLGATVGGGEQNSASGDRSAVGGGHQNTASGGYATIPGGHNCVASGSNSFAAGRRAKATNTGSFVWADNTDADFTSTATNQFLIRATGGVGIGTDSPSAKLHVGGTPGVDGIMFPDGTLQTTASGSGSSGWIDNGTVVRLETTTDNVGIGTNTPSEKLDVVGNIHASGTLSSGNSIDIDGINDKITATSGTIDFDDETLVTTGGVSFSAGTNNLIVNNDGISVCATYPPEPSHVLHVQKGFSTTENRIGVFASIWNNDVGDVTGVHTGANSFGGNGIVRGLYADGASDGARRYGVDAHSRTDTPGLTTGESYGVRGSANDGAVAYGVYGRAEGATTGYGVYGSAATNGTDWAGYFDGNVGVTGDIGIGTTSPTAKIHIGGTPGFDGIRFPDGTFQTTAGGVGNIGWKDDGTVVRLGYYGDSVGIGTLYPEERLHVSGTVFADHGSNSSDREYGIRTLVSNSGSGDRVYGAEFYVMGDGVGRHSGVSAIAEGTSTSDADVFGGEFTAYSYAPSSKSTGLYAYAQVEDDNTTDSKGAFLYGNASSSSANAYGIEATASSMGSGDCYGGRFSTMWSGSGTHYGIYASASGGGTSWAGYFDGDVRVTGTFDNSKSSIIMDHPIDPENKWLKHSSVNSPDMKNVYDGVATLDINGQAIVILPEYFEALNGNFRYQLTCIGGYAPIFVEQKILDNRFVIAGGKPEMEVSWQVTGIRKDAYADANRLQVEVVKSEKEQGQYLHPTEFGMNETSDINFENKQNAKINQELQGQAHSK